MKNISLFILIGILLSGCSNSGTKSNSNTEEPKQKEVVIQNDMENAAGMIPSWNNEITVVKMPAPAIAHSGEYVSMLDKDNIYSYTFADFLKNINNVVPKKIIVNGWANSAEYNEALIIVMDINVNGQSLIWRANPITSQISTLNEWHEFTTEFIIDLPVDIENHIKIFASGGGKKVYFDDLKITFEY